MRSWPMVSAVLAVSLLAGALGSARSADAAFPGENGRIVFSAGLVGGASGLFTVAADGSDMRRLTTDSTDRASSWSHDGSRIVFQRRAPSAPEPADREYSLYLMNADGSGVSKLPHRTASSVGSSWAPDGRRLVFTGAGQKLFVADIGGGAAVPLVCLGAGTASNPAWSPDGRWIAAQYAANGTSGIFLIDPIGRGGTWLTREPSDSWPAWRPDGHRLAFTRAGALTLIDSDGGNLVTLLTPPPGTQYSAPTWSPDGQKLAVVKSRPTALHIFDIPTGILAFVPRSFGAGHPDWQALNTGRQPAASAPRTPPCPVAASSVVPPDRLVVARVAFSSPVLRSRRPFRVTVQIKDRQGAAVEGALVKLEPALSSRGQVDAPTTAAPTDRAGQVTVTLRPTRKLVLQPGRRLVLVARARTPGGTFVGGASTRRLVSVRVSSPP